MENTMISEIEKGEIVNFVTADDKRARLALKIILSQDDIRRRLQASFTQRLIAALENRAKNLGSSWCIINEWIDGPRQYKNLGLKKKTWISNFGVVIQPDQDYNGFGIGVFWTGPHQKERVFSKLKSLHERKGFSGKTADNWPYYFYIKQQYRDWRPFSNLASICLGTEALDYICTEILALAKDAEAMIDELMHE
jgi:hypothetical protein